MLRRFSDFSSIEGLLQEREIAAGGWLAARQDAPNLSEEEARDALARLNPLWKELFLAKQSSRAPSTPWWTV